MGSLGRLSDEIAATYKFKQPVYVGEIDLAAVLASPTTPAAYQPLARFPGISRDVSFVVSRAVTVTDIKNTVEKQGFELCRSVEFVDVYEGKGLGENERSITIRLEYRSPERTLVEDEVEALHQQIVASVEEKLSVKQRV